MFPQGWSDDSLKLDDHFEQQRHIANHADAGLNHIWFLRMKKVLGEIDSGTKCIRAFSAFRFLDLGCVNDLFMSSSIL